MCRYLGSSLTAYYEVRTLWRMNRVDILIVSLFSLVHRYSVRFWCETFQKCKEDAILRKMALRLDKTRAYAIIVEIYCVA